MRDKSHCILNFEQEPELLEFWEDGKLQEEKARDGAKRVMLSDTELRLSSGKVITSRHIPSSTRSPRRNDNSSPKNDDTLTLSSRRPQRHTSEPPSSNSATISDRRIARRDEMGLLGVPRQQQLALLAAERKAQHAESAARRETQWVHNKRANTLKHDQMQTGPMAKAKAGLHNLLPR